MHVMHPFISLLTAILERKYHKNANKHIHGALYMRKSDYKIYETKHRKLVKPVTIVRLLYMRNRFGENVLVLICLKRETVTSFRI